jgi:hypothetical protein
VDLAAKITTRQSGRDLGSRSMAFGKVDGAPARETVFQAFALFFIFIFFPIVVVRDAATPSLQKNAVPDLSASAVHEVLDHRTLIE